MGASIGDANNDEDSGNSRNKRLGSCLSRRYMQWRDRLNPSSHDSTVIWDHILNITASLSLGAVLALALGSNALAFEKSTFFDAALCEPPYSTASATRMYDEAEKLAKADMSLMTAAVYKLPADFGRQGFKTDEVVFAGTSFGVLVEGLRADDLAKTYHLSSDGLGNLFGTATKSYGRALAKAEQPAADMGVVSVIARESAAFPGKTLLACEFVSHEDLEAMKSLQSQSK